MNVVSLFDGCSTLRHALQTSNIKVDNYWASEIDKNAMKVSSSNWTDVTQIGDIRNVNFNGGVNVDLMVWGSACQNFSLAGNKVGMVTKDLIKIETLEQYLKVKDKGLEVSESTLFWDAIRLLKVIKPKYFLMENVHMSQYNQDVISNTLEVKPICINSNLLSFQNRKRLYWTNIPNISQPEDKKIYLRDCYDKVYDSFLILKGKGLNKLDRGRCRVTDINSDKCPTLMKSQEKLPTDAIVFLQDGVYRYPTKNEMAQMQNLTEEYFKDVNTRVASGLLGNGFTSNVISFLLGFM